MPGSSLTSSVLNAQHCPSPQLCPASHLLGISWLHVPFPLRGCGQLGQDMPCHLADGDADIQRGRASCLWVSCLFIDMQDVYCTDIYCMSAVFLGSGGAGLGGYSLLGGSRVRPPSHLTESLGPLSGLGLGTASERGRGLRRGKSWERETSMSGVSCAKPG